MPAISHELARRLAQAVCGDDHLACSWPNCGCKVTKKKINAVALVVSAALDDAVMAFTGNEPSDLSR